MNTWLPVSLASALFLQAGAPVPSVHPQFSGTWRLDEARSESVASADVPGPVLVQITQTDEDFTVVTTQGPRSHRVVHEFVAGPAAPFSIDGISGRAYWNGAALVTEGTRLVQGQTVATRETRTLSPDGAEMTVEVVVIVQHGYSMRGGKNYGTARDVYRRTVP